MLSSEALARPSVNFALLSLKYLWVCEDYDYYVEKNQVIFTPAMFCFIAPAWCVYASVRRIRLIIARFAASGPS